MSHEPRLVFLNSRNLGQPGSLESVASAVQNSGFSVINLSVGSRREKIVFCGQYDQHALDCFEVAYENRQLTFEAREMHEGFDVLVRMHWEKNARGQTRRAHVSAVCFQTALFTRSECNPEHYASLFLDLGKTLYKSLTPDFGWLDICEPAGYTTQDEIDALALSHIYWANFFGPGFVRRLGTKRLLDAPAWSVEELGDGGVLLVLSSSPGYGYKHQVPIAVVKAHLGIE